MSGRVSLRKVASALTKRLLIISARRARLVHEDVAGLMNLIRPRCQLNAAAVAVLVALQLSRGAVRARCD